MATIKKQYPFDVIESKWHHIWEENKTFHAWNPGEKKIPHHPFWKRHNVKTDTLPPKYYILDMFPYPSGAGLHVGHPEGYTATDILARYYRAKGFNVLHPMGWDAFGLPAEQYAVKTGQHPRITTETNINTFRKQIKALGFSYDWDREVNTTDPQYFKWTQWIFLKIYNSWFNPETNRAEPISTLTYPPELQSEEQKRIYRDNKRLAYVAEAPVNWCPALGTVLSNEEVIDGKSEVGGFPVIRKPMRQWMLRITAYADRLLKDLDLLEWSHSLKEMQTNWIGRSEGAEVTFIADTERKEKIIVFTTRADTLFGATYMVLAPEHKLIDQITPSTWPEGTPDEWKGSTDSGIITPPQTPKEAIEAYRSYAAGKSDLERTELSKTKTGVFTGAYAINPVNGKRIPIWIADYVLSTYGTGAIMAVPAHDSRDLEFAQKFNLPIIHVVQPPDGSDPTGFLGDGISINSGFLSGKKTPEAKKTIIDWLQETQQGHRTINYKLRDWLFSRQRYWGEPFPIIWKNDHHEAISEDQLPLLPPEMPDYKPTQSGEPPLARATDWVNLPNGYVRETNTMPQWAGSCWYYLRYIDANNKDTFCSNKAENYWMGTTPKATVPGIDLYVGGTEHAVLHLLYARFWHKILFDLGFVSTPEPFHKLVNQGLILGEDSQKMSKSRGNVVNPDDVIREYGADAFRLYEMFMGPLEMVKPWNTKGVEGVYRFLGRVWRLFISKESLTELDQNLTLDLSKAPELVAQLKLNPAIQNVSPNPGQLKTIHSTIKKVTDDLENLRFNTAISALMVFVNEAITWEIKPAVVMLDFLKLLQPLAPHITEELAEKLIPFMNLEYNGTISYLSWPQYDEKYLAEETFEYPVQVNGKLRDKIKLPISATQEEVQTAVLSSERIKATIANKTIKKIIIVPRRIVNIAIS